jgi:diaminopimelate decarboxylase
MLDKEADWTLKQVIDLNLLSENDTAIICQSWNNLDRYLNHLKECFPKNTLHAIAIKTNPHPEVLKHIADLGFGLEAASIEELQLAKSAGVANEKIVFDSPVKTQLEITFCQENLPGIRLNVNSLEELKRIPENPSFIIGIRINPLIDVGSPSLYNVSADESKFGIPISDKGLLLNAILEYPITQLHIHSGSSMTNLESSVLAVENLFKLAEEANQFLAKNQISRRIETLDIGGGLPPEELYFASNSLMNKYAEGLKNQIPDLGNYQLITEFGQWVHFYSGFAYSRIEYVLNRGEKELIFVHLGADYLMRDAYAKPRGVVFKTYCQNGLPKNDIQKKFDIAGPLCFAGDYLVKNENLPNPQEGDWLALLNTGSNSLGLWSRHCSRSIPKVFGVDFDKEKIEIISERKNIF